MQNTTPVAIIGSLPSERHLKPTTAAIVVMPIG